MSDSLPKRFFTSLSQHWNKKPVWNRVIKQTNLSKSGTITMINIVRGSPVTKKAVKSLQGQLKQAQTIATSRLGVAIISLLTTITVLYTTWTRQKSSIMKEIEEFFKMAEELETSVSQFDWVQVKTKSIQMMAVVTEMKPVVKVLIGPNQLDNYRQILAEWANIDPQMLAEWVKTNPHDHKLNFTDDRTKLETVENEISSITEEEKKVQNQLIQLKRDIKGGKSSMKSNLDTIFQQWKSFTESLANIAKQKIYETYPKIQPHVQFLQKQLTEPIEPIETNANNYEFTYEEPYYSKTLTIFINNKFLQILEKLMSNLDNPPDYDVQIEDHKNNLNALIQWGIDSKQDDKVWSAFQSQFHRLKNYQEYRNEMKENVKTLQESEKTLEEMKTKKEKLAENKFQIISDIMRKESYTEHITQYAQEVIRIFHLRYQELKTESNRLNQSSMWLLLLRHFLQNLSTRAKQIL